MKGLEIARAYWEEHGLPMLERNFPALLPKVAAGLCGPGSECFGFDDEVSRDHDFEPGFCLFLPGEEIVSRRDEFLLERAYAKLPEAFMGLKRSRLSPVGGDRHGVIRADRFFEEHTGRADGKLSLTDWLHLPDYALAEAVNGDIFRDDSGFFTRIREGLVPPPDAVNKKLAGAFFLMGQAGQYNYARCLRHGEGGASHLAADTFVRASLQAAHLLSGRFLPYYKWAFRSLRSLPEGEALAEKLEAVLTGNSDTEKIIEDVCQTLARQAKRRDAALPDGNEMERLAYAVNDRIREESVRNLHLLYTVRD